MNISNFHEAFHRKPQGLLKVAHDKKIGLKVGGHVGTVNVKELSIAFIYRKLNETNQYVIICLLVPFSTKTTVNG